ncbi:MAG: hypothetical protein RLY20_2096, partial [Verrucomicrobiota bacterium]
MINAASAEIIVLRKPDFACVQVIGRGNFACGPGFKRAMNELIDAHPARLILALKECRAMDSTFLGVLCGSARRYRQATGGKSGIELFNASDDLVRIIEGMSAKDCFLWQSGELVLPEGLTARRLDLTATKMELKEVSLDAHEFLSELSEDNRAKFAELVRKLKDDLAKLKSGEPPALPGFDIAARNQQAGEVGGDFYDFAPRSGLRAGVLIADACGKSYSAAQMVASSRPILREELAAEQTPAVVLKHSLQRVAPLLPEDKYVTALCLVLDAVAHSFRVARAGHEPLAWFHARTGNLEFLTPKGMPLGPEPTSLSDATFVEREHLLESGDVLFLYTDGLNDALSPAGATLGQDGLSSVLKNSAA